MLKEPALHKNVASALSAFLYRFRGYILGVLAIVLVVAPPSLFPKQLCINDCLAGILVAVPLFVASSLLRVRARQYIGEHTRGKIHDADELVTVGVYSRVRHPLYISNTGFAIGFTYFHLGMSLWVIPFALVIVLFEVALARIEDRFLERKFGDLWRAWAKKTPAFFPRFKQTLGDGGCDSLVSASVAPQRTFWQAFFADSSTWLWLMFCNLVLVLRKVVAFYV